MEQDAYVGRQNGGSRLPLPARGVELRPSRGDGDQLTALEEEA
jgi:hypothetical protein